MHMIKRLDSSCIVFLPFFLLYIRVNFFDFIHNYDLHHPQKGYIYKDYIFCTHFVVTRWQKMKKNREGGSKEVYRKYPSA